MSRLLSKIKAPNDVKKLAANELPELCDEIREEIISTVADNGGHLASNLGVVELTVALHRVFTLPEDCIVWDVGHQSYAHKLLTGREEAFSTLRREDGLSGFPSREESDCDPFTTGHSSASISSALGLSVAKALAGDPGHVIAVIGDGGNDVKMLSMTPNSYAVRNACPQAKAAARHIVGSNCENGVAEMIRLLS